MNAISLKNIGIKVKDPALYEKYAKSLNNFLEKESQKEIILCGSLAKSEIHENSDIDLFIIDDFDEIIEREVVENNISINIYSCSGKYPEVKTACMRVENVVV